MNKNATAEFVEFLAKVQDVACTEDFCFVCSRCTEHWGEHSDEQLLAWSVSPLGKRLLS